MKALGRRQTRSVPDADLRADVAGLEVEPVDDDAVDDGVCLSTYNCPSLSQNMPDSVVPDRKMSPSLHVASMSSKGSSLVNATLIVELSG